MRSAGTQPRHAVGLYRVSTAEQGSSGLGLEAQQASVRAFAAAQGWTLVAELSDISSGKDDQRPGFQAALTRCRQLGAVLVAARLDRSRERSARPFDGHSIPPKGWGEACTAGREQANSVVASSPSSPAPAYRIQLG